MAGSIGKVIIPVVSTFDPAGIAQAKAGLKDLAGAQGAGGGPAGGGGSGSGGAGGSAGGISALAKTAAGKLSSIASAIPGGEGLGSLLSAAAQGPVEAGAAVFALSQRVASNAAQVRKGALDLNVSVDYYGKLEKSARNAGMEMGEVTAGISRAHDKVLGSAIGGNIGESMFLESLGLTREDMEKGVGNVEYLAQRLKGMNLSAGQKAAVFGSVRAADAIMGAGSMGGGQGAMGLFDMNAGNVQRASQMMLSAQNYLTNAIVHWSDQLESWQTGKSMAQISDARDAKVAQEEAQERQGKLFKARQESGASMLPGLLEPYSRFQKQVGTNDEAIFSADPQVNAKYHAMANASAREQMNQGVAGVSSRYENLQGAMRVGKERYNASTFDFERQHVARQMGMQVQDYADSMTHAGGLAGAADMNSVAGYSQLVGAQEQMRQSQDSRAMAEMIIQQLPPALARAIRESFAFALLRPKGPMNY